MRRPTGGGRVRCEGPNCFFTFQDAAPEKGAGTDFLAVGERLALRCFFVSERSCLRRVVDVANQDKEFVEPVTST